MISPQTISSDVSLISISQCLKVLAFTAWMRKKSLSRSGHQYVLVSLGCTSSFHLTGACETDREWGNDSEWFGIWMIIPAPATSGNPFSNPAWNAVSHGTQEPPPSSARALARVAVVGVRGQGAEVPRLQEPRTAGWPRNRVLTTRNEKRRIIIAILLWILRGWRIKNIADIWGHEGEHEQDLEYEKRFYFCVEWVVSQLRNIGWL